MQYFTHQNCIPIILTSLLALGFFLVLPLTVAAQTTWNDTEWTVYDTITIDATQIDDDLTDFPVYVDLADLSSRFWSTTPTGSTTVGTDIRVTTGTSSPSELPRELVAASSTAQTGELHFKADSISSTTDTVFRIYYNGTTTGDYATSSTYGAQNVWTNGYLAVYHMNSVNPLDSTSNSKDGVEVGSIGADSFMGDALDFDGTSDYVDLQDTFSELSGGSTMAVSMWANADSDSVDDWAFSIGRNSSNPVLLWDNITGTTGDDTYTFNVGQTGTAGNRADGVDNAALSNTWQHVVGIMDGGAREMYIDGGLSNSNTGGTAVIPNYSDNAHIASWNWDQPDRLFGGSIDEVRISSSTRSAAWINAEYINQSTTTDFYTVDGTEWNPTDWTSYDTITIKHENIDESLTDFPVYVDLADLSASFWATTPTSSALVGTDIRVTTDDATPVELPRELVAASSTAETGELHFKADFLNKDADTTFRIYYNGTTTGDYLTDATYGAENVWSNGFVGVWHLGDGDSTSAGFYKDSTGNNYNGTLTDADGDSASVSGHVGGAMHFNGDADYVKHNFADFTLTNVTVSTWVNVDAVDSVFDAILATADDLSVTDSFQLDSAGSSVSNAYNISHTDYDLDSGVAPTFGNWEYLAATLDGTSQALYIDATEEATVSSTTDHAFNVFKIAANRNDTQFSDATIDEVRISSTTRSAAWINAEYLNQSTTTDFYALGAGTSGTGSTTLSDHDATQVDDAFNFMNKTNEPLFAFKLTPQSGTSTITELTLELRGATAITVSDFSNITLYRDHDNDALYDATDTAVGTGVMTLGNRGRAQNENQIGTIVFAEDFLSTTTQNYLVVADWNYPERGSSLTINLHPEDIEAVDTDGAHVFSGSVDHVQHSRNNRGGGGGSSAAVGTPAPAGDGDVFGGGSGGGGEAGQEADGENIAADPDFFKPASNTPSGGSDGFDNPENVYESDGVDATAFTEEEHSFGGFGFGIPAGNEITGIEVKVDASTDANNEEPFVYLSWDGGSSLTDSKSASGLSDTGDIVLTLGGPSDDWGRTWSPSDFSDSNFLIRLEGGGNPPFSTGDSFIDAVQVRVYHQRTGGSSGGGGAI